MNSGKYTYPKNLKPKEDLLKPDKIKPIPKPKERYLLEPDPKSAIQNPKYLRLIKTQGIDFT